MSSALLAPVELDFLWEELGAGDLPYPLELRSHGATMDERAALRAEVRARLAQRGLADPAGRPEPWLEDRLGVLAGAELSLDGVYVDTADGEPVLALAAARGGQAVQAVQDARGLHLTQIPADGLASAIIGLLPQARRGAEKSITVPLEQLMSGPGVDFMQRRAPGGDGRVSADEDRKALSRLHAQERERGGQLGVNGRAKHGGRTRLPVLSWFDTETGRYFTQATRGQDGRDWITIAPADAATLRHRLNEMLASAARASAGV